MSLSILCTADPYFVCELGMFTQNEGAPMGNPLSGLLADLVIENKIEKRIAQHPIWGSSCNWVRKADDTFLEWTKSMEELEEFHTFLNDLHPTIKWSKEIAIEGKLPFLDVLVLRSNNQIHTTVYRKQTASDRYLHFTSAQSWQEKTIAIKTLRCRAEHYCSTPELKSAELNHLLNVFLSNGYPYHTIHRLLYSQRPELTNTTTATEHNPAPQTDHPSHNPSTTFYAPYHPCATKLFRTLQSKFNIPVTYKQTPTLEVWLTKRRPPIPPNQKPGAIYATPCECPAFYVGETKRTAQIRNNEEKKLLNAASANPTRVYQDKYNDYGFIDHHRETGHILDFDSSLILDTETHTQRRKFLEGLYIHRNKELLVNKKAGTAVHDSWLPLLGHIPHLDLKSRIPTT
jgi:hypothetical protein